ncbi:hypothetical protein V8E36_001830 [Tilletia maclaganii]
MPKSASQPLSSSKSKRGAEDKENRGPKGENGETSGDVERLTRKIRRLEDALADAESERDDAVKLFEELQALRNTKVEQQLDRVKEKAMEKHQLQEKLISTLKERVKSLESAASLSTSAEGAFGGSATLRDGNPTKATPVESKNEGSSELAAELRKLKDEMASKEKDWKLERSSLQDHGKCSCVDARIPESAADATMNTFTVRQLERENKAEREASKAALNKAKAVQPSSSVEGAGNAGSEDADKVRSLYEDLTGLTISSVETYDARHGHRRFRGVFANQGYHHLQLCLEESTSDIASSSDKASRKPVSAPRKRQDLVYIPQIQEDRDADLLKAGTKLVDDIVYEIDSQQVTIKEGDVDIGGNPSAEEADEGLEDGAKTVNNFANAFSLQPTSFDKKTFLTYLKGYMKEIKSKLPDDRVADFEKGAQAFAKKLVANFKDYEFYTGESMNPDGMIALLNYREDGVTPYWTLWKDGLKETKV